MVGSDSAEPRVIDRLSLTRRDIEQIDSFTDALHYQSGNLQFDGHGVSHLIAEIGSPSIIYSRSRIVANYEALVDAFRAHCADSVVSFALKSCYVAPCVRALVEVGASLEVMSELELRIALEAGCPSSLIISNGVARSESYVEASLGAGVALLVIDSLADLRLIARVAQRRNQTVDAAVRITNSSSGSRDFVHAGTKLGASVEDGTAEQLLVAATAEPLVNVVGLHSHSLSRCHDLATWMSAVRSFVDAAMYLSNRLGLQLSVIDLGGGLDSRLLTELNGLDVYELAERTVAEIGRLGGDITVVVESGRFIAADAAIGTSHVAGVKRTGGETWVITDLGSNVLIPVEGAVYQPIPIEYSADNAWSTVSVGDQTCAPTKLASKVPMPEASLEKGVAVLNCGAYTTVFAEAWAFPIPSVTVIREDGVLEVVSGPAETGDLWRKLHGWTRATD